VEKVEEDGSENLKFNSTEYIVDRVKSHMEMFGNLRTCDFDEIQLEASVATIYVVKAAEWLESLENEDWQLVIALIHFKKQI